MTLYRQRSSSHSSQQSWGSTSGDSGLGEHNPQSNRKPGMNGENHSTAHLPRHNGHLVPEEEPDRMFNGHYAPPLPRRGYYQHADDVDVKEGEYPNSHASSGYSLDGMKGSAHRSSGYASSECQEYQNKSAVQISSSTSSSSQNTRTLRSSRTGREMNYGKYGSPQHNGQLRHARSIEDHLSTLSVNGDNSYTPTTTTSDVYATPPRKHVTKFYQGEPWSYDVATARILELHRNLAHSYNRTRSEPRLRHPNRAVSAYYPSTTPLFFGSSEEDPGRDMETPPLMPVKRNRHLDFGKSLLVLENQINGGYHASCGEQPTPPFARRSIRKDSDKDSCHNNSTGTLSSSSPSTPTSDHQNVIPNGYATIRGKPSKFNLHTITENLGQLFTKSPPSGQKRSADIQNGHSNPSVKDCLVSPRHSSTPLKTWSIRKSSSHGNILGIPNTGHMTNSTDDDLDSDENQDDYGFLSPKYSALVAAQSNLNKSDPGCRSGVFTNGNVVSTPVAMHKNKSPTPAQRILPKRWRQSKLLTPGGAVSKATTSLWKPKVSCSFSSFASAWP